MKKTTHEVMANPFGFIVYWEYEDFRASFKAYQVVGRYLDNKPMFFEKDFESSDQTVDDTEEAEIYLSGTVKWDGCSQGPLECGRVDSTGEK